MIETLIAPGEWYATFLKDGKQFMVVHKIVSEDGKIMTLNYSGADAQERWAVEEAFVRGNWDALEKAEVFDLNMVCHIPPFPEMRGLQAFKEFCVGVSCLLTELRWNWEEVIIEGNTAVQRFTIRAKHTGTTPMFPAPSTGKEVIAEGCAFYHLRDDKIVEFIEYSNYLGFFQQLGIIPAINLNRAAGRS